MKWFFLLILCSSCFANSIDAVLTNNSEQNIKVFSDTSVASISPNLLKASSKSDFKIKFNTVGTKRGVFTFYNVNGAVLKRVLVVLNGSFAIDTAVCVPIASCKSNNPLIINNTLYFTLE